MVNVLHLKIVMEIFDDTAHSFLEPFLGNFTLPDNYDMPAKSLKGGHVSGVTLLVAPDFLLPKLHVCAGFPVAGLARMPMPKTSMNEYHRMILPKHNIRFTWKSF